MVAVSAAAAEAVTAVSAGKQATHPLTVQLGHTMDVTMWLTHLTA
jgi:hypothetical protein